MTRAEFEYNVDNMEALIEFCRDNDCPVLCDIRDECDLDAVVCEDIRDATRWDRWTDIKAYLEEVYEKWHGYWFLYEGRFDYTFISEDDFDYYYEQVLDWAIDDDFFDFDPEDYEEEGEDSEDEESDSEPTEFSEDEPIDICNLFGAEAP